MAKKRKTKSKAKKSTARKTRARKTGARKTGTRKTAPKRGGNRWSGRVTRESDALTLEKGVFTKRSPKAVAQSLKRSAERSRRRKSGAYRSAMSMLTFYINRGGKVLSTAQKARLEKAKDELRALYGRD